MIANMHFQQLS